MTVGGVRIGEEPDLTADEFAGVLRDSGLASRRPADDHARLETMLQRADLIMTARREGRLLGVARTITDFVYCAYLSDLCVSRSEQGSGIGRDLVEQTRTRLGPSVMLVLLSAPGVEPFYRHLGMTKHEGAFVLHRAG
jgi:GNAT superfamily N-acetyltransferase